MSIRCAPGCFYVACGESRCMRVTWGSAKERILKHTRTNYIVCVDRLLLINVRLSTVVVRSWLRDQCLKKSFIQWLLRQTPAGQQIIHTDHGIGGVLSTELISPLLIRRALILRPLSSSIMNRMTEVGLQSEAGVPRDKDWKRNRLQSVN